ncbi:unnamed protein product [Onchocerca flexuosa]|uniref:Cytochrome C oxidase subunit II n=1 Tax=Onchocerca flexuosa TaxID=387005 RepID=A0A183HTP1_9BILA|nr:unnamed protein product [Onchocerca flexuosa]
MWVYLVVLVFSIVIAGISVVEEGVDFGTSRNWNMEEWGRNMVIMLG